MFLSFCPDVCFCHISLLRGMSPDILPLLLQGETPHAFSVTHEVSTHG